MRVVQLGLGAVGKENIRHLLNRGHEVVGIVDRQEVLDQIDLAELGFKSGDPILDVDLGKCLAASRPDMLLQATKYDPDDMIDVVTKAAAAKCDIVSINPIVDIREIFPETYQALDRIAREGGIRVLGVGAVPGFFSDMLPLFMTGACAEVSAIKFVRRNADFSKWGPAVIKAFGFGEAPELFRERTKNGEITLFRSLWQSAYLIAHQLGWPILDKEDIREPLVSERDRKADHVLVKAGNVGGFSHRVVIHSTDSRTIDIGVTGIVDPRGEDETTATSVEITGSPSMRFELSGDILLSSGSMASSSARLINSMLALVDAKPGLRTSADLPLIVCK
jgi:4-hydroxy-tetrahydrodipicolinate reductase